MSIPISSESKNKLMASLQRYFEEELDEEIGDLKAELFIDFIMQEIGAVVYNMAIKDAQTYLHGKTEELDAVLYKPEFAYWANK